MKKYVGQPCTSCRCLIKEDEQVVVCPVCGSPYHKDCYAKEGKCINFTLHESGEAWQPEAPSREFYEEHPEAVIGGNVKTETAVCPRCNQSNLPNSIFCSQCGMPLDMQRAMQSRGYAGYLPFANAKTESQDLDGVSLSDYGNYVGTNQYYYLPKFLRFSKKKSKISFNWTALVAPHLYFLNRKMPVLGFATLVLRELLTVPYLIIFMSYYGYFPEALATDSTLTLAANICLALAYLLSVGCLLFANLIYYKKAKKQITKIRAEVYDDGEATLQIRKAGGTNMIYLLLGVIATSVLSSIVSAVLSALFMQ